MIGSERMIDTLLLAPREQQGVDHPFAADHRLGGALELGVEEAQIERGVVRHQRRSADKGEELVGNFGKQRLVFQKVGGETVNLERRRRHLALGIDVTMEALAGGNLVVELDAADLDQPVALIGIESRRLGVQHDFPHRPCSRATPPDQAIRPGNPAMARKMP